MTSVIGLDLGGTALKLGLFQPDGSCLRDLEVPTPQPSTPEAVVAAMAAAIGQLDPDHTATAIGIGTPGPADQTGRIARVAINLAGWQDVPLAEELEAKTGRSVVIANDANCAGVGEAWLGAGREFQDLIVLTLGTGVGGGDYSGGKTVCGPGWNGGGIGPNYA